MSASSDDYQLENYTLEEQLGVNLWDEEGVCSGCYWVPPARNPDYL